MPLDDESSACGCTTIVFGGVRMQMPEKIFGSTWIELRNAELGITFCFDCAGALQRWAELSLELVDDRRAGRPAWSGWTCDVKALRETWQRSIWGDMSSYSRREEWDWTYRTDLAGTAFLGKDAAGHCARTVTDLQDHLLIKTSAPSKRARGPSEAPDATEVKWAACGVAEYEKAVGCKPQAGSDLDADDEWSTENVIAWRSCKLIEDSLAELGVSRVCLRFREFEHGWEMRVRWWSCLNPGLLPSRGVPHARMRETTVRLRFDSESLSAARFTEERLLYLTAECVEQMEGVVVLDADIMREHMPVVSPTQRTHIMVLERTAAMTGMAQNQLVDQAGAAPSVALSREQMLHGMVTVFNDTVKVSTVNTGNVCTSLVALVGGSGAGHRGGGGAGGELMAASSAGSGRISLLSNGHELWSTTHRGVEALALVRLADGPLLLSCGSDGCVRAWDCASGEAVGAVRLSETDRKIEADRMPDGQSIVQCVAANASHQAAACGARVLTLHIHTARQQTGAGVGDSSLLSASRRPLLPSVVSDLCLAGGGGSGTEHCLIAGTIHSGVYVWLGAQLAAATAPASLWLECRVSVEGISCFPQLEWPYVAHCRDRTVRLWSSTTPPHATLACKVAPRRKTSNASSAVVRNGAVGASGMAADGHVDVSGEETPHDYETLATGLTPEALSIVPMSFGGLSAGLRAGAQTALIRYPPLIEEPAGGVAKDRHDASPGLVLAMADGAAGVITWRLAAHDAPQLDADALGIDSRRAGRLPLPGGLRALCIALRPVDDDGSPAAREANAPLLACGCDKGAVVLLTLAREAVLSCTPVATAAEAACILPVTAEGKIRMVEWSADGEWLYAGTDNGICCIRVPPGLV